MIEGNVTKYATKITFKEGDTTVSTYIKIGTNGESPNFVVEVILSAQQVSKYIPI